MRSVAQTRCRDLEGHETEYHNYSAQRNVIEAIKKRIDKL